MAGFGHHFLFSGQADLVSPGIFRPVHGAVRPADDGYTRSATWGQDNRIIFGLDFFTNTLSRISANAIT